jgi:hypothetical protein
VLYCTCWWYSLCNVQYRSYDEQYRLGFTLGVEFIQTCIFLCLFDV